MRKFIYLLKTFAIALDCERTSDGSCFNAGITTGTQIWQLVLLSLALALALLLPLLLSVAHYKTAEKKRALTVEHLTLQKLKTIYSLNSRIQFKVLDKMRLHISCDHEWIWMLQRNTKSWLGVSVCLCLCVLSSFQALFALELPIFIFSSICLRLFSIFVVRFSSLVCWDCSLFFLFLCLSRKYSSFITRTFVYVFVFVFVCTWESD